MYTYHSPEALTVWKQLNPASHISATRRFEATGPHTAHSAVFVGGISPSRPPYLSGQACDRPNQSRQAEILPAFKYFLSGVCIGPGSLAVEISSAELNRQRGKKSACIQNTSEVANRPSLRSANR